MGMSGDYIEALKSGATFIRIGSAFLDQDKYFFINRDLEKQYTDKQSMFFSFKT